MRGGGEEGEKRNGGSQSGERMRKSVLKYSSSTDSTCTRIQLQYHVRIARWNGAKLGARLAIPPPCFEL